MVAVVVCPLKTRYDACAGGFPSRYPTPLTLGCKKPRSSLERERKVPNQVIGASSAPMRPGGTFMDLRTVVPDLKSYKRAGLALMFAKIQDPLEMLHLS